MVTDRHSRRWWLVAAMSALIVTLVAGPAAAEPGEDDGAPPNLKAQLEEANRAFVEAQGLLDGSRKRQADLTQKIADLQTRLVALAGSINGLINAAYRNNRLGTAATLLASVSSEQFVDRAAASNNLARRNAKRIRDYNQLGRELADTKKSIDAEVAVQEQQLAQMAKRKKDAETAIARYGGGGSGGFIDPNSPAAQPAPRNSDGTWPKESCTIDDPTTGGCISPRLLHAYTVTKQTVWNEKGQKFDHYVSCYRSAQDGGEHPKGKACDWAADKGGFGQTAAGESRAYGNALASFYIKNAGALGVLYVIWFRQIWQTATGRWENYGGQCGSPSCDHTNHVHLSVV